MNVRPSMCGQCPFRRGVDPTVCDRRGTTPLAFVGQVIGPFFLPCHLQRGFSEDPRDPELQQCPGAAVFRSNVNAWDRGLPEALARLPKDTERVFGTFVELVAHHFRIPAAEAEAVLHALPPDHLLAVEMRRAGVRVLPLAGTEEEQNNGGPGC